MYICTHCYIFLGGSPLCLCASVSIAVSNLPTAMTAMSMMHLIDVVVAGRMSVSMAAPGTAANAATDAAGTAANTASPASTAVMMVAVHLRMVRMSDLLHDRIEAVVLVGRVLDDASGAIGLLQRVCALDEVTITRLPLLLVVTGVGILHAIVELVFGMVIL